MKDAWIEAAKSMVSDGLYYGLPGVSSDLIPPDLAERCIKAGCPSGGTVLDPFGGAGTTGLVADRMQRDAILIELNPEYAAMARHRISSDAPLLSMSVGQ